MIKEHQNTQQCTECKKEVRPLFILLPNKNKGEEIRQENKGHGGFFNTQTNLTEITQQPNKS